MAARLATAAATAFALAALGAASAGQASAQVGMTWSFDRFTNPDTGTVLQVLRHYLPDSDFTQFWAGCFRDETGPFASVELEAYANDLPNDITTEVWFTGDGLDRMIFGNVIGQDAEFGITGARIRVELDDRLWDALATLPVLDYRIVGYGPTPLSLEGAAGPVGAFLAACAATPAG